MCTIDWQVLLEYIKVILSWPPIALVIAILLISKFRKAIDDFLKRTIEWSFMGQQIKAAPPQQEPPGISEDRLAIAAEENIKSDSNKSNNDQVQLPPELVGDPQAPAAVAYVKTNPAQTVVEYKRILFAYNAERLFNRIYGTQISLLEYLASRPETPTSLPLLAKFHKEFQHKAGNTEYQLRDYINFLVVFGVIANTGEENNFQYAITQHGVEFLSYIKANYSLNWNQRAF